MGMTMTQKILAAHSGEAAVTAGQLINAKLDVVLGNDITTPVAINEFEKAGFDSVFDNTRVNIVLDHFVPNKDIKSAAQSKQCREFADKYDILNFFDVGRMGVEHALLPEQGIVTAGDCIIGADSHTIVIDLDALEPTVSYPHLPENTHLAKEGKDIKIDQIVIGSCTNGRIEDMEAAYEILKGKHIAKGVRGIIIPATMAVYKECILRGYTEAFIDAGCIVSTPTCGPCLGGYMGILAAGERCVSTTNRNFVGRMGHVTSEVILASPAVAAASAIAGCVADPRK